MAVKRMIPGRDSDPEGFEAVRAAELRMALPHAAEGLIGLGLSGGGIRSATFCLGVLHALAGRGRLRCFDYLSTVSGGGYIGSWLSAWIARAGLETVQDELAKRGSDGGPIPQTAEPAPVVWLRKYSNYLAPKIGIFSIDSLTLMSIWLRNVLLNMSIVVSFMVLLLLLPRLLIPFVPKLLQWPGLRWAAYGLGLIVLPLGICASLTGMARAATGDGGWLMKTRGVMVTALLPGLLAAIFGSLTTFGSVIFRLGDWLPPVKLACGSLTVAGVGWLIMQFRREAGGNVALRPTLLRLVPDAFAFSVAALVAINVVFALLCAERLVYSTGIPDSEYDYVKLLVFGTPGFLVTFGVGGFVFVGLAGRAYYERSREWWGRLNGWFLIIGTVWFLWMAVALYVPALTKWVFADAGVWFKTLTGLGWLGSLAAALLGPRVKSLSHRGAETLMTVLNVAAFIVIAGFVVGLATLTDESLTLIATAVTTPPSVTVASPVALAPPVTVTAPVTAGDAAAVPGVKAFIHASVSNLAVVRDAHVGTAPLSCVAFLGLLLVLLLFGWRIDVNKFSLHNMYKNRLIRCYLGASRRRNPQPFTGFDEDDDLPLASLAAQRPLHIVNTSLNLSQGRNLAWQERKAASFVLTPVYCGFSLGKSQGDSTLKQAAPPGTAPGSAGTVRTAARTAPNSAGTATTPDYSSIAGFRLTKFYSGDDESTKPGFSLGMAMAVSGAAASPNMGANTRPALAFVMTLFNARLGRWSANPARPKWYRASPSFGLNCFLQELFGWSNERRNFVYLSDGGHFENLGLYELVRRRCRTIWLVDASADPERNCEDLGRAIRQCRVDFGVEIDLPLSETMTEPPALFPKCGFASGTIDYGAGYDKGTLVYIKPTLCVGSHEPDDVLSYAKREKTFPHQTTADQFFDESQFESYRRLGLYIGEKCLERHLETLPVVAPG